MILRVDTRCLAILGTKTTTITLRCINHRLQIREAREEAQYGTYRTNGVTIRTAILERQYEKGCQSNQCHNESNATLQPYIHTIESITIHTLCPCSQQVVSPLVNRSQEGRCNTSECTIRSKQGCNRTHTCYQGNYQYTQHDITKDVHRLGVSITVFLYFLTQPTENVLENTQRTNHRTIDTSHKESEQYQGNDHSKIQCQYGRQELNLRHPAKPCMNATSKVEEEQGDTHEEYPCQYFSDLTIHNSIKFIKFPVSIVR